MLDYVKTSVLLIIWALVSVTGSVNFLSRSWTRALKQTLYEQEVEDTNAIHRIDNHLARRLIVMPLTSSFNPNQADPMHGKVQYGDKCSLPTSLGRLIFEKRYEVPWLFELKPVRQVTSPFKLSKKILKMDSITKSDEVRPVNSASTHGGKLDKAYISPLDFRSPENYIFLPKWLMHDLDLAPNDQVDISFVRIKSASLVVFQPLSVEWDDLLKNVDDPKVLLEHEINKYSSLTAGSTIYIEIQGKEYPIFVKETIAEGGVSVKAVCVQDSDIRTDIDRTVVDKLILKRKQSERT